MKTLLIIPTYNEKLNIASLIREVNMITQNTLDILVIDDNSPDGTAEAVKEEARRSKNVYLIERSGRQGLGTAYASGFKYAIANGYDQAVQMDADFSHSPSHLPELIRQLETYDFIIGSRYVENGGVINWPIFRLFVSRAGSFYANLILGSAIKDFTGGFNGWNIKVLKAFDLDAIRSNGYSFQIEMKYKALRKGFSFCETPIIFVERRNGQSKMSFSIILEAIWKVWKIR